MKEEEEEEERWRAGNGKGVGKWDSRAVLIAPVENEEGVGLPEEILFVQFVPT